MYNDRKHMGKGDYKFRVGAKRGNGLAWGDVVAWLGLITIIAIVVVELVF